MAEIPTAWLGEIIRELEKRKLSKMSEMSPEALRNQEKGHGLVHSPYRVS